MNAYLILKLEGPMQAWGTHTYEATRPSELMPTRSGLIGLLGACLGIARTDTRAQADLGESFVLSARLDHRDRWFEPRKMMDFHTVLGARKEKVGTVVLPHSIITHREYLLDASFTVALKALPDAVFDLDTLEQAVRRPRYTPFLGRRSCPLGRPLFECRLEAEGAMEALAQIPPGKGTIYTEEGDGIGELRMRDVPIPNLPRQFGTRRVFIRE